MINFLFDKTPLYFMTQSFWRDEGFSYLMAKRMILSIATTTAKDFNPPLYYFLLHFWLNFFGKGEVALRSLSLVFFTINIYIVFLFLKNIFKVKGREIFAYLLLFSLNPFLLYFAFEGRIYSLFALLSNFSFYYFLKKEKIKYLIFTVLGPYTPYFFLVAVLTQMTYLFFLPLIYALPNFITKTSSPGILFTGYERFHQFYDLPVLLLSLFFFLLIIFYIINKTKTRLFFFLSLWSFLGFFLIFFISFFKPLFLPRYLIFASAGFNFLIIIHQYRIQAAL